MQVPQSLRKCFDEALQSETNEDQSNSRDQEDIFVANLKVRISSLFHGVRLAHHLLSLL